jgi:hypothetical protein
MTKENDTTEEHASPEIQPTKVPNPYQGKVKVQSLNVKEAEEFREHMGLSGIFYFVIGNTIKGGRK